MDTKILLAIIATLVGFYSYVPYFRDLFRGKTKPVAFFIFLAALFRGEKNITTSDWLCLLGAFAAMGWWAATEDPLGSVILICIIDAIGFIPTFRKSYKKPYEETMQTYTLSSVKYALALLALQNYSLVTVLYPASLILMNILFVGMLISRRKLLKGPSDILPA